MVGPADAQDCLRDGTGTSHASLALRPKNGEAVQVWGLEFPNRFGLLQAWTNVLKPFVGGPASGLASLRSVA